LFKEIFLINFILIKLKPLKFLIRSIKDIEQAKRPKIELNRTPANNPIKDDSGSNTAVNKDTYIALYSSFNLAEDKLLCINIAAITVVPTPFKLSLKYSQAIETIINMYNPGFKNN
jgi:hypothetical protein